MNANYQSMLIKMATISIVFVCLVSGTTRTAGSQEMPEAVSSTQANKFAWELRCLYCPANFRNMMQHSLQLDNAGHIHAAYGYAYLYYAFYDGVGWQDQIIDQSRGVGEYADLALDQNGYSHISYYDRANGNLKYAFADASGWQISAIDSAGDVGQATSIRLNSNGYAYISYYDVTNQHLKLAFQDAAGWHRETVDSTSANGEYNALALDSVGYPHIAYRDTTHDDLRYAYKDASGWHISTVDNGGSNASLALDGNNHPHIGYSNGGLKYAYHDPSGWHFTTITPSGYNVNSLVLDHQGYPHLVASDDLQFSLNYYYLDGSGWHSKYVGTSGTGAYGYSLTLSQAGNPYLSYLSDNWKIVHLAGDAWQTDKETAAKRAGGLLSAVRDQTGYFHVAYHDAANGQWAGNLFYGYEDASGWHEQMIDSDVGASVSLALDDQEYAHISYTKSGLRYAYQDAGGWHNDLVDSLTSTGYRSSLALDDSGFAHIAYIDGKCCSQALLMAHQSASGWSLETVDYQGHEGDHFDTPALIKNGAGNFHMCYSYAWSQGELWYALHDALGWHKEKVQTGDFATGSDCSIRVDQTGKLHIANYSADLNQRALRYAI